MKSQSDLSWTHERPTELERYYYMRYTDEKGNKGPVKLRFLGADIMGKIHVSEAPGEYGTLLEMWKKEFVEWAGPLPLPPE